MVKSFLDRRHAKPDYELESFITGVRIGDTGKTQWLIELNEGVDKLVAADIFEKAAEVLRENNG